MADSNKRQKTLLSFFALPKQSKAADQLFIAPRLGRSGQDNKEALNRSDVALARGKQKSGKILSVNNPTKGFAVLKNPLTDQKPTPSQPLSDTSHVDTDAQAEHSTARKADKSDKPDKQNSSLLLRMDSPDPAASDTDNEGSLHIVNMNAVPSRNLENINVYEQQVKRSVWSMFARNSACMLFCTGRIVSDKLLVIRAEASAHSAQPREDAESGLTAYGICAFVCCSASPSETQVADQDKGGTHSSVFIYPACTGRLYSS